MKKYKKVFITNIPAFYKVNLFNAINNEIDIFVIFIAKQSNVRNSDFYGNDLRFEHVYLTENYVEERNKIFMLIKLIKIIKSLSFDELIFSGWEIKESVFCSLLVEKAKNSIVIESSILETKTTGLAWNLKKLMLTRMSKAYPSGELQKEILNKANFNGKVSITHGVGISNVSQLGKKITDRSNNSPIKFLYVGRLSKEKNINSLIEVFSKLENDLYIVGEGGEKEKIEATLSSNVHLVGYIDNILLKSYYDNCDCFILPSLSEPWGLVIEEALTMGLPVIVSNKVGCRDDLVTNDNGIVFDVNNLKTLEDAIKNMKENYSYFRNGALKFNVKDLNSKQLDVYIS